MSDRGVRQETFPYILRFLLYAYCLSGRQVDGTGNGGTAIEATDFEDPDGEALRYRCGYKKDNGKTSFVTSWSTSSSFEDLSFPSGKSFLWQNPMNR